ncbi:uncharacterized protein LOC131439958 [Malaya genurostris]|uniref:uncharacterized protein LOC131439958 n=1 Tax=Malaya genurostris TaxID=325434 RepID=UPI0026F3B56F|nr:uncharacterized protein LOC131439958 [Malaya genurostris]
MPTTIEDLPEEMLVEIFSYLEFEDCLAATTVCRLWSGLALRWKKLRVDLEYNVKDKSFRTLLASSRPYRHFSFDCSCPYVDWDEPAQILAKFSSTIEILEISTYYSSKEFHEFLAKMTTLCTNLKRLAIEWNESELSGLEISFQPLNDLSDLYLSLRAENLLEIDFRKVTPNITNLCLGIGPNFELSQQILQHFSPRLEELKVWFYDEDLFNIVCEMNFPLLKKLNFLLSISGQDHDWSLNLFTKFFRRCANLEEVTLLIRVNKHLLESLAQFCCNLQSLRFNIMKLPEDCFRCLSEMRCLKVPNDDIFF